MAGPQRAARLIVLTILFGLLIFALRRIDSTPTKAKLLTTKPVAKPVAKPVEARPPQPPSKQEPEPQHSSSGISYDWSKAHQFYPPKSIKNLPTGKPHSLPPVQAPLSAFKSPSLPDPRRDAILHAFKRSYKAYKKGAWMRDELAPISGGGKDTFGGWAATLVDALDTLWIMDLKTDFYEATAAVAGIDYSKTSDGAANLFETTIRHLGGLLSAYDLSGETTLLDKAVQLGDMLYMAFDTPNRLPGFWLNFKDAKEGKQVAGTNDPSAAPGSLTLEFTRLSQLTGDSKYYAAADGVTRFLERVQDETALPGMWPTVLDFRHETAGSTYFTLGALADSLYEYLPKMHALLGGVDDTYSRLYTAAIGVVEKHMLFRPMLPAGEDVLFVGDVQVRKSGVELTAEGQHLTCFAGGMFALGGRLLDVERHVDVGERLARGCAWAYGQFPTGLMPEIFDLIPCESSSGCEWDEKRWWLEGDKTLPKGWKSVRDAKYILRPEAIESVFLLYRMTGKEELRNLAWGMWEGIVKSTETELAYSAIRSVKAVGETDKADSMEVSFIFRSLKCLRSRYNIT